MGGFLEGLQTEGRERFGSRENVQLTAEKRESNHCQEHFHSPEVSIKPQSLFPCSQDTPKKQQDLCTDRDVSLPGSCLSTPRPDPCTHAGAIIKTQCIDR